MRVSCVVVGVFDFVCIRLCWLLILVCWYGVWCLLLFDFVNSVGSNHSLRLLACIGVCLIFSLDDL